MNIHQPAIAIDFDGVFNAVAQMPWESAWDDMQELFFIESGGGRIPALISSSVSEFFHYIAAEYPVEVIWLTTWVEDTVVFPQYLNLPEFKWIGVPEEPGIEWWKTTIIETLSDDRPLLWIDDEIPDNPDSREWKLINFRNTLETIVPKSSIGLTPEHLREIEDFCIRYTTG